MGALKKRRKKKEGRIPKDPTSLDFRGRSLDRGLPFRTKTDLSGEYMGHSFESIRQRVAHAYRDTIRSGMRLEYMDVVDRVLDEMGFRPEKWERGAVYSALSRHHHARRKEKKARVEAKKIEEARQVELFHNLGPGCD